MPLLGGAKARLLVVAAAVSVSSELARKTAEVAARDVGVREEPPGSNDGPRIRSYLLTVGLDPGQPYCAAAVSYWVQRAAEELFERPLLFKSGSAMGLWRRNPHLQFKTLTPEEIPCLYVEDHGGGHGHVGIVIGLNEETGVFQEISANTNPAGSRDGGGVYALERRTVADAKLVGFLRIA